MIVKAFCVAYKAHKGQKDKGGRAYIFHPVTVAFHVKGHKQKVVALLHDVIEDTNVTYANLIDCGFSDDVVQAVKAITKIDGEPYENYLSRVCQNEIAKDVKLADLRHNCDLSRLKTVTDRDKERVTKYKKAIAYLT